MNTLTVQEIAAGGGVFEGRYAQTLAQSIIDIQHRLDDQESVCEGEGVSFEVEILNLRSELAGLSEQLLRLAGSVSSHEREGAEYDARLDALEAREKIGCTHPPDCGRCNWCGYVQVTLSDLAEARRSRDDARRERSNVEIDAQRRLDEAYAEQARLATVAGDLRQQLVASKVDLAKYGRHTLLCRLADDRCTCGFVEALA